MAGNKKGNLKKPTTRVDLEIDLHGMTIEAALRRVSVALQRRDLKGGAILRCIHGHSNTSEDSIKEQLWRSLQGVWSPRVRDAYREGLNAGSTLIVLEDF
jgi:DNA-nicking Smr family endonuclease